MNTIVIHSGNLVRDIEIATKDDKRYARFTVASNRSPKSEAVDFFNCVAFGDWVDSLSDLTKGTRVNIRGNVMLEKYQDHYQCSVICRKVERPAPKSAEASA